MTVGRKLFFGMIALYAVTVPVLASYTDRSLVDSAIQTLVLIPFVIISGFVVFSAWPVFVAAWTGFKARPARFLAYAFAFGGAVLVAEFWFERPPTFWAYVGIFVFFGLMAESIAYLAATLGQRKRSND